ncbi:MAG: FAD-dependent thymidylate synthase, partial [Firmicutes bacterium]|nr:FAD-dependent thymidylate synthase [Bacillota bacterium]
GLAKYSRSHDSLQDNLLSLSQEKAAQFLQTFYFSYGHASIADLAHIALAIEDISMLAAMEVVDEPIWDGQERSTRYQDFTSAPFYRSASNNASYDQMMHNLFTQYHLLWDESFNQLQRLYPNPGLSNSSYLRTLKARAFDIARYLLPLGTLTSLGQITSARVLEQQISRLLSSDYTEVRQIAESMKQAATTDAPFHLPSVSEDDPVAPTLIKYAQAQPYASLRNAALHAAACQYFSKTFAESFEDVELFLVDSLSDHQLAILLYAEVKLPYRIVIDRVKSLSAREKDDLWALAFRNRGPHDEWPRAFRLEPLLFDITMDVGAFRDFNRHRRLTK